MDKVGYVIAVSVIAQLSAIIIIRMYLYTYYRKRNKSRERTPTPPIPNTITIITGGTAGGVDYYDGYYLKTGKKQGDGFDSCENGVLRYKIRNADDAEKQRPLKLNRDDY